MTPGSLLSFSFLHAARAVSTKPCPQTSPPGSTHCQRNAVAPRHATLEQQCFAAVTGPVRSKRPQNPITAAARKTSGGHNAHSLPACASCLSISPPPARPKAPTILVSQRHGHMHNMRSRQGQTGKSKVEMLWRHDIQFRFLFRHKPPLPCDCFGADMEQLVKLTSFWSRPEQDGAVGTVGAAVLPLQGFGAVLGAARHAGWQGADFSVQPSGRHCCGFAVAMASERARRGGKCGTSVGGRAACQASLERLARV